MTCLLISSADHTCEGKYSCMHAQSCVPIIDVCDGIRDCPQGDDEQFCAHPFPNDCICNGFTYKCQTQNNISNLISKFSHMTRKIDISNNTLSLLPVHILSDFPYLIQLNLSRCQIQDLSEGLFLNNTNLRLLDISYNMISHLSGSIFNGLVNLEIIHMSGNPLVRIDSFVFESLSKIQMLSLSALHLSVLDADTFAGLHGLLQLDMSHNRIKSLGSGVFNGLDNLQHLDISGNDIETFDKYDFNMLTTLNSLKSDEYMFCCFVDVNPDNCYPKADALASCSDLMSHNVLRIFLWLLGGSALFGNTFVISWRMVHRESSTFTVTTFLVTNLAVADFFMGVYMITIASVDVLYRGIYIEQAKQWKTSVACSFLGVMSTVASEMSVLILFIITIDRLMNIVMPFSSLKLTKRNVRILMTCAWSFMILVAVIPLFPSSYFQGQFYSRSGVCLSIHLTDEEIPGWEYSVAIFHAFNFAVFMFIFLAYAYMYNFIKESSLASGNDAKKREMAAAKKMTLIVITDFLCWVPINIMGEFLMVTLQM